MDDLNEIATVYSQRTRRNDDDDHHELDDDEDNDETIQFLSICCDELDGAREIIEREEEPRWKHMDHYFMEPDVKESLKRILAATFGAYFHSVPFYVILNERGTIQQMGNTIDWDRVLQQQTLEMPTTTTSCLPPSSPLDTKSTRHLRIDSPSDVRAFVLEDLDF